MAVGDGVRHNITAISDDERDRFVAAIQQLDVLEIYSGKTYWDLQEDTHKAAHIAGADVHGGPGFLGWHREICNRFEVLLRMVDADLSLHYWDWTTDPRTGPVRLLSGPGGPGLMGASDGDAGAPFAGFESTQSGHPLIWRDVDDGDPVVDSDATIVHSSDGQPQGDQYGLFDNALQGAHNYIHSGYIRGTIGDAHYSFHDPFVFLLHSNVDRLWALWQFQDGERWRLDPAFVYGSHSGDTSINTPMEPWAGGAGLEPWVSSPEPKTAKHSSIVAPPCYDTNPIGVDQVNSEVRFNDVPEGETTVRAAVFQVYGCHPVTLRLDPTDPPNAPYGTTGLGTEDNVDEHGAPVATGRIWFQFTGETGGTTAPDDSVTIHCDETGEDFSVTLKANSIDRPKVAVVLSLDQSASMDWPAGTTGATRMQLLKEAADHFVGLVQAGNGVGLVRFDHDAYPGLDVTEIATDSNFDVGRIQVANAVAMHATNPAGNTSVGDGIVLAQSKILPVTGYDNKALLAFTDGQENSPQLLGDVMDTITVPTFAIGLGNADQVNSSALSQLTQGTGGYLLLTDHLSADIESRFRLEKYFLQILAGVSNTDVVLDPADVIAPGETHRIPFFLNDADIDATVILLADRQGALLTVESPDGDVLDPATASTIGATFIVRSGLMYYRFTLPAALGAGAHAGTWHAVVRHPGGGGPEIRLESATHGRLPVRYSVSVHSWSNLRLAARLAQSSFEPGSMIAVRASLSEFGIPVENRAVVGAVMQRPDATSATLAMPEIEPGVFGADFHAALAGVYHVRVGASGTTLRGVPFTREQTLTGAITYGGDRPPRTSADDSHGRDQALCRLLECLLADKKLRKALGRLGVDHKRVERCLRRYCKELLARPSETDQPTPAAPPGRVTAPPTTELTPDIMRAVEEAVRRMLEQEPKPGRRPPKGGGAQGKDR
jgi:Common central domain of tyrosinase